MIKLLIQITNSFFIVIIYYFFMKEMDERGLYLTQKISNVAYNAKYTLLKYFQEYKKDSLVVLNDQIFILGRKFIVHQKNVQQIQQEVYEIFHKTPWLTYRSGFPQLPNEIVGSYVSDTGWGCMVRVGQMLFAQVIKYHKNLTDKTDILKVISLFSDFDKTQPFSIHKIARLARIQYGLKPGQWYNPSQIAFILGQLHRESIANSLKLKFNVFHSGNLFFDVLTESMLDSKAKCNCEKQAAQLVCQKCNKPKNAVATIVLSRIGLNSPQKKYLTILQKLMQSQFCQGVIGGKPKKALYFVGNQKDHFIYLDPHYVHQANNNINSQQKCKNTAIDSSIGICFYLKDIQALNKFHRDINKMKNQNYEDFFIFVADKTPNYIKQSPMKSIQLNLMKEDNFQFL